MFRDRVVEERGRQEHEPGNGLSDTTAGNRLRVVSRWTLRGSDIVFRLFQAILGNMMSSLRGSGVQKSETKR